MKNKEEIEKRLKNLCHRYEKKFLQISQEKHYFNCRHNHEHLPRGIYKHTESFETSLAPRSQTTLVVIQPDQPINLCMLGSDDSSKWSGDICDSNETSKKCPFYSHKTSLEEATKEFDDLMKNDEYVYENYRDVATLQWVLETRYYKLKKSFFKRFLSWIRSKISSFKTKKIKS